MRKTFIPLAILVLSASVSAQLVSRDLQLEDPYAYSGTTNETTTVKDKVVELNKKGVEQGLTHNNYEKAIGYFREAVELSPRCFICRYNVGRSLVKLEKYGESIEVFESLVKEDPAFANGYASLGEVYTVAGKPQESLAYFTKALELEPDDPVTLNNYANALDRLERFEDALRLLDKAIEIKPEMAAAHCSRGVTLFRMGKKKDAYKSLMRAHELDPNDAETHNNLGVVLDEMGKSKKAFKHYQEAVRLKPDFTNAIYNLGLSYIERGERRKADEQLKVLEKINPVMGDMFRKHFWGKYVLDATKAGDN